MASVESGVATLLAAVVVLLLHEGGHYLAARRAGIPASHRRLELRAVPPHVALYDGQHWQGPFDTPGYRRAYRRFDVENDHGRLFTAGGFLAQSLVVVPLGMGLAVAEIPLGTALIGTSLTFVLGYVLLDIPVTLWRSAPFGDTAHLWRLDRLTALATLGLVALTHMGGLALLSR